jgi:GntR family transcriptional regulator
MAVYVPPCFFSDGLQTGRWVFISKYSNIIDSDLGEKIESYIIKNDLLSGDQLPSERELCETLDVSRMTLRDSLKKLCNTGIIETIQGKGTFVAPKRIRHNLMDFSVGDNDAQLNRQYKQISTEKISVEEPVSKLYGIPRGNDFYQVKRLLIFDPRRMAVETLFFAPWCYSAVDKSKLESVSVVELCKRAQKPGFGRATIDIDIAQASFEEAMWLGISEGETVTREKLAFYGKTETPGAYAVLTSCAKYVYYYADLVSKQPFDGSPTL